MQEAPKIYEEILTIPKRTLSFDETNYEKNFAPLIVGVAGGSASGKTTLCENIKKSFKESCIMISLDSFYKDLPEDVVHKDYNFDHPRAYDFDLFFECCSKLIRRECCEIPIYSFITNKREKQTIKAEPKDLIFIEGILALYDEVFPHNISKILIGGIKRLRDLMSLKVFVHCDDDIRLCRRVKRDSTERGRQIEGILYQYHRFVRPAHLEFVEPTMNYADIIVPSNRPNEVSTKFVVQNLKAQLNGISRLKSYFTNNLFYNADLFTNVWLTPFSQKDNISVFCEITYYLQNKLIFEKDEIQKQLIKNYLTFFHEIFDLKYFRRILKYFLFYGLELLKKSQNSLDDLDLIDLNNVPMEIKTTNKKNLLIVVPFIGNHNFLQIINLMSFYENFKNYRKVFFLNIFSTMKYILQVTKMSPNFYLVNITCLSNPKKFMQLVKEKCLDKTFDLIKEFENLGRYYKYVSKKIEKMDKNN